MVPADCATGACTSGICGTTPCGPTFLRLNEVAGGFPDFIEVINRSGCPLDLSMISITWQLGCDLMPLSFTFPMGATAPPMGVVRALDTSTGLMMNEYYVGTNICHNPGTPGWVALCNGPCNLTTCGNVLDYFEESNTGTPPTGNPSCATFTPGPFNNTGETSAQSANRTAFMGTATNGRPSDWALQAFSR